MRKVLWAAAALTVLTCPPAWSQERGVPTADAAHVTADDIFKDIYTREAAWRRAWPTGAANAPKVAGARLFPRIDPATQEAKLKYWLSIRRELDALDPSKLSAENRVNLQIYCYQIDTNIANQQFREYEKPFNSDTAFWTGPPGAVPARFADEAEARAYIARLADLKRYYDEQMANMRAGLARGFAVPKVTLAGRDAAIKNVADSKDAESSVFWAPFKDLPASISPGVQADIRAKARAAITDSVLKAYRDLLVFYHAEYEAKAPTALGAEQFPNGKAYYQSRIAEFTTLDLTADQIHQIGLDEVARIRKRMDDVIRQVDFKGDFPAFLTYLRTDPKFYPKSGDELLKNAAWIAKRFDGKASRYFGRMSRGRFTIVPVPADIAPYYTAGRGGASTYLVNTYNLPSRSLYAMVALTLHESAPGHALQLSLASEMDGGPAFRRELYISAYGEGWALYCEKLGEEMGMYETPYDLFGMLSYQAWRAARLVVDTGIHAKGWTREQAQKYLHDNTALADHEIETEVDRYIGWPGQALSYYLGQLTIEKARAKAEKALGPRFNIRWFHDTVLQMGSVPMPVLEARIDRFIAERGPNPWPAPAREAPIRAAEDDDDM